MSQRDRYSDGTAIPYGIANRSQTIAVTAPEAASEAERLCSGDFKSNRPVSDARVRDDLALKAEER